MPRPASLAKSLAGVLAGLVTSALETVVALQTVTEAETMAAVTAAGVMVSANVPVVAAVAANSLLNQEAAGPAVQDCEVAGPETVVQHAPIAPVAAASTHAVS